MICAYPLMGELKWYQEFRPQNFFLLEIFINESIFFKNYSRKLSCPVMLLIRPLTQSTTWKGTDWVFGVRWNLLWPQNNFRISYCLLLTVFSSLLLSLGDVFQTTALCFVMCSLRSPFSSFVKVSMGYFPKCFSVTYLFPNT